MLASSITHVQSLMDSSRRFILSTRLGGLAPSGVPAPPSYREGTVCGVQCVVCSQGQPSAILVPDRRPIPNRLWHRPSRRTSPARRGRRSGSGLPVSLKNPRERLCRPGSAFRFFRLFSISARTQAHKTHAQFFSPPMEAHPASSPNGGLSATPMPMESIVADRNDRRLANLASLRSFQSSVCCHH